MRPRVVGVLRKWDGVRGFGFLRPTDADKDVFVHATVMKASQVQGTVVQGQKFEFEVEPNDKGGRAQAIKRVEG